MFAVFAPTLPATSSRPSTDALMRADVLQQQHEQDHHDQRRDQPDHERERPVVVAGDHLPDRHLAQRARGVQHAHAGVVDPRDARRARRSGRARPRRPPRRSAPAAAIRIGERDDRDQDRGGDRDHDDAEHEPDRPRGHLSHPVRSSGGSPPCPLDRRGTYPTAEMVSTATSFLERRCSSRTPSTSPAPIDEVFAALLDVERVAPCVPGRRGARADRRGRLQDRRSRSRSGRCRCSTRATSRSSTQDPARAPRGDAREGARGARPGHGERATW